jgi:two-component system, NarL family, invasion response regulator UvrY
MIATSTPREQPVPVEKHARLVIADDHEIVREGIRRILIRLRPDWEICGEAASGTEAIELATTLKPNIVVLDITMPGMSGLEAARRIARSNVGCRILIFTVHDSDWLKTEIRDAGGHGYVQKSQVARDLITAIEVLLEGGTFFGEAGPETPQGGTRRLESEPTDPPRD